MPIKKPSMRTSIIFMLCLFVGIVLYIQFGTNSSQVSPAQDSLFVQNLQASSTIDEINDQVSNSRQTSITRALKRLSPAVVGINVTQVREYLRRSPFSTRDPLLREFFPELFKNHRYEQEISQLGSGFIISSDGYILTNEHVVENAREILITMTSGDKKKAEIIGTDPTSDVALLKIEGKNLPFVKFGNSDQIILGEWAIAVGNPFGLFEINNRATVTVGVISALNRDFGEMNGRVYQDMIQTDASINHGNSGGPLCNAIGEVIGMNAFIYTGGEGSIGIGFSIPINRITRLIEDLKKDNIDRDFWIGIRVKNLNSIIARKMGYNEESGVVITYIDRNSPAEKAGLNLGDIIFKIGNTPIFTDKNVTEAIFEEDLRVGDVLNLEIWRDGNNIKKQLDLESIRNY